MLARSTAARLGGRVWARSLAAVDAIPPASRGPIRRMMATQAPTSFSHEKMEADARYRATMDIPESLLHAPPEESPYSIRGKSREGRAAYLDMSATTPLDPRVLDAMAPYMVSNYCTVPVKGLKPLVVTSICEQPVS